MCTLVATLLGLWGFAFADPVFGIAGNAPPFFASHGVDGWRVVAWVVVTAGAPPLLIAAALRGLVRAERATLAARALVVLVGVLFALIVVPRIDDSAQLGIPIYVFVAAGFGVIGSLTYALGATARRISAATWFSPLVFAMVFLLMSPASAAVRPSGPAEAPEVERPVNLVMVVLDEFPLASLLDDKLLIDRARFPGFGRLADTSTWYRDTTTPSVRTEHAVPAILTGQEPATPSGQLPDPARMTRNLFSMLASSHRLNASEPVVPLCQFRECVRLDGRALAELYKRTGLLALRRWLPNLWAEQRFGYLEAAWGSVDDADLGQTSSLDTLLARLSSAPADAPPSVWFTHAMLPHRPWGLMPGGFRYPAGFDRPPGSQPGDGHSYWSDDSRVVDLMRQRLILQVQALDELIGRLVDALADPRLHADTMLVVTADHGISFKQGGAIARGWSLWPDQHADIARVPLFIKYPGQSSGELNDRPAALVDLLPTIADVMRVRLPETWNMHGASLAGLEPEGRERAIFDDSSRIALRDSTHIATAARQYDLPGATSRTALFSHGPLGPLVGQHWRDLPVQQTGVPGRLVDSHRYAAVDTGVEVPALVEVELAGAVAAEWAAVAVNGVVAGTGPVYRYDAVWRIAALVDPRAFRNGPNDIQIAIGDAPAGALHPLVLS